MFGLVLTPLLAGCGTYVPSIVDNPLAGDKEREEFVQAIFRNIRCEVQDAVAKLCERNPSDIDPENRNLGWFDGWAAEIKLTITTDEKGELNPTGAWLPSKNLFSRCQHRWLV